MSISNNKSFKWEPYHVLFSNWKLNYLEIGIGTGELFNACRQLAHKAYGVEPGTWIDDSCVVSGISQVPENIKFDVIVMYDLLEHLENPIDMLKRCKRLANGGAKLYCSFPNKDSMIAQIKRERWLMVRPLGHVHYFSDKSIEILFSKAGLELVTRIRFHQPTSWCKSLKELKFINPLKEFISTYDQWGVIAIVKDA